MVYLLPVLMMLLLVPFFAIYREARKHGPGQNKDTTGPSQTKPVKIGERAEAGGIAFTVEKVEHRVELGRFNKAKTGREFLLVEVVIETTTRDEAPYNPLYLTLKDARGFVRQCSSATYSLPEHLRPGTLAKGEKVRGTVAFAVEQGETGLVLSYRPTGIAGFQTLLVALEKASAGARPGSGERSAPADKRRD